MPTTEPANLFVRTYGTRQYRFPVMLRHNGTVLAFAMDDECRISYTVLDYGAGGSASDVDSDHWLNNPQPLSFAREITSVGYGVADQFSMPKVRIGSSSPVPLGQEVRDDELDDRLSTTACLSADTPFQVVSDDTYIYVFRQADTQSVAVHVPIANGTLLVDRFVLAGTTLQPKLEVRYQRSRSRTRPAGNTDSLGAKDLNGVPFVEPTQHLSFVPAISEGRFAAVLVPTQVAEVYRWQLFSADAAGVVWSYSIERTSDGLFDTMGTQPLTCTDHPDLYAVNPGTCPRPSKDDETALCGKTLVARVPVGGASGTALAFPSDGTGVVTLDNIEAPGAAFTVETWVRPDAAASGERTLLGWAGDPATSGPSLWLSDNGSNSGGRSVRIRVAVGSDWHDVTTPEILACSEWNHLAVTFASGLLVVYVGGRPVHMTTDLGAAVTADAPDATTIGAAVAGYGGLLDDLRLWSVALPAQDVASGMHTTLTGLEAGLIGYWRFDEGVGNHTWDAASTATGTLNGQVSRITSDAPIARAAGLSRSPLRLSDRHIAGGLSAEVYYQQEAVASGYPGAALAPVKRAARVALAMITSGLRDGTHVSVLDLGVAVDGTLAQCKAEIELGEVNVSASQDARKIQKQLVDAQRHLTKAKVKLAADTALLTPKIAALAFGNAVRSGGGLDPAPAGYPQLVALAVDVGDARRRLDAAAAMYQPDQNRRTEQYQPDQDPSEQFRSERPASRHGLDPAQHAAWQAWITARTQQYAALTALQQALIPIQDEVDTLTDSVATDQSDVDTAQAEVLAAQHLMDGGAALPMPLLAVDAAGLTTSGATLGFAAAVGTPVLFESALGRVSLYFRNVDGEFLVAYYDAYTDRARMTLTDHAGGSTVFTARSTAAEYDNLSLVVASTDTDTDATCTVTVTLPGAIRVVETWPGLPRDPVTLAMIVNGATRPISVGTLAASTAAVETGGEDVLTLAVPLVMPIPASVLLQIGRTVVTTTKPAAKGAISISISTLHGAIVVGSPVVRIVYDYSMATSTRAGTDLSSGSVLIRVDASAASGSLLDGSAEPVAGRACEWSAPALGRAVDFDGTTTVLRPSAGVDPAAFDVSGDVTIESWVNPIGSGVGRIVTQASGQSSYSLGVRSRRQALHYDGAVGHGVTLANDADMNITGAITLEAWIRPDYVAGTGDIVAHGFTTGPDAEVVLRTYGGYYWVGSWPVRVQYPSFTHTVDNGAAASIPDEDWKSQPDGDRVWVHLAGVYDGAAWRLYRNGTQIAETASGMGAVPVGVPWTIGNSSDGNRPFQGDIEEVRIWSEARSPEQIRAGMGVDVSGAETSLVGAWVWDGMTVHDASAHRRDGVAAGLTPLQGPRSDHTVLVAMGGRCSRPSARSPTARGVTSRPASTSATGCASRTGDTLTPGRHPSSI